LCLLIMAPCIRIPLGTYFQPTFPAPCLFHWAFPLLFCLKLSVLCLRCVGSFALRLLKPHSPQSGSLVLRPSFARYIPSQLCLILPFFRVLLSLGLDLGPARIPFPVGFPRLTTGLRHCRIVDLPFLLPSRSRPPRPAFPHCRNGCAGRASFAHAGLVTFPLVCALLHQVFFSPHPRLGTILPLAAAVCFSPA